MYELLSNQDKLYFYQVGQGADRDYVRPLIKSESKFLIREMKKRFNIDITDETIFAACDLVNKERKSIILFLPPLSKCVTIIKSIIF